MQVFRLTNGPDGLGLSCTAAGLSLAGTPLLQKTDTGFAPRPAAEIASLLKTVYGVDDVTSRLVSSLPLIARALNRGELARAAIAAVLTRTPELSSEAARRLAAVNGNLAKYDPNEPRDWHGRWTADGAEDSAPAADRKPTPQIGPTASGVAGQSARGAHQTEPASNDAATTTSPRPMALEQEFEGEYDDLGPVEFAKRVIEFGDHLARESQNLSSPEKDRALAEYAFLQDRLSFWLAYEYTPPTAHGNLLSAAQSLFQGAILSGIVQPGHLPKSMLDVAANVWALDSPPLRPRFPADPALEVTPKTPAAPEMSLASAKEVEGLGGTVDNSQIGIVWGKGIKAQGAPFETYVERQLPNANQLPATAKTFDQFDEATGMAVSDKTLNTLSVSYIRNPQRIYWWLTRYVDAAADYTSRTPSDAEPTKIQSKMIQLAIPEYTSPTQWRYLFWALGYGSRRGVSIVITRVRE
jgi:hypothetical protein